MQSNCQNCIDRTLVYEGGKVDDPRDPGGRTNEGITQATYNAYLREKSLPPADVYNITDAQVQAIYVEHFWNIIQGDQLPAGVDFATYDAAVNSGPGRATIWLQQALGDKYTGTVDGVMGSKTLQAIEDYDDMTALVQAICSHRLGTLQKLSTWATFGKGWSARIASVQKASVAMVAGSPTPNPVDVSSVNGNKKAPIIIPQSTTTRVVVNTTTVVTGAGTIASQAATQLTPISTQFPHWHWLQALIGGLTAAGGIIAAINQMMDKAKKLAAAGSRTAPVDIDADQGLPQIPITVQSR